LKAGFLAWNPAYYPFYWPVSQPQFSMIAPSGNTLNLSSMEALFEQLRGARPGLVITLSEFQGIALYAGGAVIGYREVQEEHNGNRTDRRATAVFEQDAHGTLLWRHLHETFVAG
jgi:hypothetical protein